MKRVALAGWLVAVVASLPGMVGCGPGDPAPGEAADLVVRNARVWTGVPEEPWADAVAIRGDELALVGTNAEADALIGDATEVVNADAQMVTPGFIDAHVHLLSGGFQLSSVQLREAATPEEFTARVEAFARGLEPGAWITGGNWDHERWGGELPRRDWIDDVTPDHPVWVSRLDSHMALANSAALEAAAVDASTGDVEGGEIVRGADGRPTGVLKDNAMSLVARVVPEPTDDQVDRALDAAMAHVAERGITSVHHMGSWDDLEAFRRARQAGRLTTRIYAAVPLSTWERLAQEVEARGRGDEWLRIGGLKGFVDGSLGSHTAAFFDPYADAPDDRGLLVNAPEDLYAWTSGADEAGLHVMVHAIGDRAIATQLDVFERVIAQNGPRDRRFRIEHAQHIRPDDIPRFAELGVVASTQPYHAIDDGRWAERVIGPERAQTTYAFRSLLDAGANLAFGSDWDVAPVSPLEGIYAAVTRRTLDGDHPGGWVPSQKINVEQALTAYTRGGAHAAFQEDRLGTLEPGKLADLVVIDWDMADPDAETIREARVLLTVVDGRVVFDGR